MADRADCRGGSAWFIESNFTPLDYAFDNYVVLVMGGDAAIAAAPGPRRPVPAPSKATTPPEPTHAGPAAPGRISGRGTRSRRPAVGRR